MPYTLTSSLEKHREGSEDYLFIVNPDRGVLAQVYEVFSEISDTPVIRILVTDRKVKDLMNEFLTASKLRGLVEAEMCEIRTIESYDRNPLIASQAGITFWTQTAEGSVAIFDSITAEIQSIIDSLTRDWQGARSYSIQTPGLPRLRETMEAELGEQFREEFESILGEFDELPGRGDGFNVYSVALLAAAKNEILFYDLGKWAEDVGLASKATFTRKKQQLEEAGVIKTSKQSIDVGRPRLRLHLVDEEADYLTEAVATTETE